MEGSKNMIRHKLLFISSFVLLIILLVGSPISAQNLSPGCLLIDNFAGPNFLGTSRIVDVYANEQLTMTSTVVTGGIPIGIWLKIDGVLVDTVPYPGSVSWIAPADGTYHFEFSLFRYIHPPGAILAANFEGECHRVVSDDTLDVPQSVFFDGRINNYDLAAPIAVYPHMINDKVGLIIYDVDGIELLVVSPQQLANVPDNPDHSIFIVSNNGVSLYRIPGEGRGLWQINAPQYNGKTYVIVFPELFNNGGYESFELDD